MRKALLIVAMLLLVTPVMAATTITAVQGTQFTASDGNRVQPVSITYSSDVNIRAFALDINIVSDGNRPNFQGIRNFKTGESNGAMVGGTSGYGIFPSRFRDFIVVTSPNWVDTNYNPTTAWNEPGTTSHTWGMGYPQMIVEMGTLYAGDANRPALSGTLFTFDVNAWGATGTFHLTIAADTLRAGPTGVIGQDGNTVTPVTFVGTDITFGGSGCTVPNIVNMNRVAARAAIIAAGFPVGVEANVAPTTAGQTVRTVIAQKQTAGSVIACSTPIDFNAVSYPIKDMTVTNSLYVNWVNRGRPACWAYPRQCRGDADGKKAGNFWVSSTDLNIIRGAISKLESAIPTGGICADFDHKKAGNFWVSSSDLNIIRAYISKLESLVPMCGNIPLTGSVDPNYWYFCVPTGAVCPTGQYCAPVAVCPNTP